MPTPQEYRDRAAAVLIELAGAKSEADRTRLKRAHGVYLRLSTHEAEAAARAKMSPTPRIRPEKPVVAGGSKLPGWTIK